MPTTSTPIFPQVPLAKPLSLANVGACVTRAPTITSALAAANIFEVLPVSTNGRKIDAIQVNGCASAIGGATTAGLVQIWLWDGTFAYLIDEIVVSAVTPSATLAAFTITKSYSNFVMPATYKLFASTTIATSASTNALEVVPFGGDY